MKIKVIALDLDGTLLRSDKQLSPRNRLALERAHQQGVWIVPCTGRFYRGMPEAVRTLPFVRYVITINGAEVYDALEDRILYRAEIPPSTAERLFDYMDRLPVIYDCYQDGWGWMDVRFSNQMEEFITAKYELDLARSLRTEVTDFRKVMRDRNMPIQKTQMFFRREHLGIRARELEKLAREFPEVAVSSASGNNIEINHSEARKGRALRELCAHLGIDPACAMAFGDGLNDVSMLEDAGVGVAMGNAPDEVKRHADLVAPVNDEDGVAQVIEQLVLQS